MSNQPTEITIDLASVSIYYIRVYKIYLNHLKLNLKKLLKTISSIIKLII